MNTYQEVRPLAAVGDGKELIQWSERDGWAHLYLYDGEGNLKNRITRGPWHVDQIVKVDEAKRVVYFLANGKEKDENPYYEHLYVWASMEVVCSKSLRATISTQSAWMTMRPLWSIIIRV